VRGSFRTLVGIIVFADRSTHGFIEELFCRDLAGTTLHGLRDKVPRRGGGSAAFLLLMLLKSTLKEGLLLTVPVLPVLLLPLHVEQKLLLTFLLSLCLKVQEKISLILFWLVPSVRNLSLVEKLLSLVEKLRNLRLQPMRNSLHVHLGRSLLRQLVLLQTRVRVWVK